MTPHEESPRAAPTIRLGVVGHRDLGNVDREVLTATVTRFLSELRDVAGPSRGDSVTEAQARADNRADAVFIMVNSLAEGADQLVAEAAVSGDYGYRLECPIPFEARKYKSCFTYDRDASVECFDRLAGDAKNKSVLMELAESTADADRSASYEASADLLLERSDMLLALHHPSRPGSRGGTRGTIAKAIDAGMLVIGIDLGYPDRLDALSRVPGGRVRGTSLTEATLRNAVSEAFRGVDLGRRGAENALKDD